MKKFTTAKLTILVCLAGLIPTFNQTARAQGVPDNFDPNANINVYSIPAQTGGKALSNGGFTDLFPNVAAIVSVTTWTNFQAATLVLGQPGFATSTPGTGDSKFTTPIAVAIDPISGKVFVADYANNRVLRFSSMQAATNGGTAEAVLGQPDFVTVSSGLTQNKMRLPQGVNVDSTGSLWVADTFNNRILRFDGAATKANGANADAVLGQPDFTTGTAALTQNKMNNPGDVFAENGRLWVADQTYHRVLRFDNAATKANGANAEGVLGQPDFTTGTAAVTQNKVNNPTGLVVNATGTLWVADQTNHRVLRFDNAAAKANGANANAVLGQPDFTTRTAAATRNGMNQPRSVTIDAAGGLYVSDRVNNRILIFDNAAELANGANASNVLGQPDFTSATANNGGISAKSLNSPFRSFFDEAAQKLLVADTSNNRVLGFTPTVVTAASVSINGRVLVGKGRGLANARVYLTDQYGATHSAITNPFGYYRFNDLAAGQTVIITIVSKRYQFAPQIVSVTEDIEELNFFAGLLN